MTRLRRPHASVVRLMLVGAALLAGLILTAGPASAHTELVSTDPVEGAVLDASPGSARLTFNEPVRVTTDAVQMFDATGAQLDASARASDSTVEVDLPDELDDGSYVVSWRVISVDGHPVTGALTFSVGAPSDLIPPPVATTSGVAERTLAAVRGATYLGLFVSAGLAIFWFLLLGSGHLELHPRLVVVATVAAAVAAIGALLQVPLSAIYQQGQELSTLADVGTWSADVVRDELVAAVLVAVGAVLGALYLRARNAVGSLATFFLAAFGLALVGHTRGYGPTWLVVLSDILHVTAGAAWVGGLVGLVLVLRSLTTPQGAAVLTRFSTVAAGLVALVAISGTLLAWRIVRSWELVDSPFGRLLIVKVAIVAVVVAVAAINRYWLLPRFTRGSGDSDLLRRTVRLEAAGLAAVLLLTGFLVERSPVAEAPSPVPSAYAVAGEVHVHVELDPGAVGSNAVVLRLETLDGEPLTARNDPVVTIVQAGRSLGELDLTRTQPGIYRARVVIPRAGECTVRVSLRLSRFENPVVDLTLSVGGAKL